MNIQRLYKYLSRLDTQQKHQKTHILKSEKRIFDNVSSIIPLPSIEKNRYSPSNAVIQLSLHSFVPGNPQNISPLSTMQMYPIPSMEMVYLPTWMVDSYGINCR